MTWLGFALGSSTLSAAVCDRDLVNVRPVFDDHLSLSSRGRRAVYLGNQIDLTPQEYLFLQTVLLAPNEVACREDLIRTLWGEKPPNEPDLKIRMLFFRLKEKFARADPNFDRLKRKHGSGIYWARTYHEKITRGRVGAAKYIFEGYADGQTMHLMPAEHAILMAMFRSSLVYPSTANLHNGTFTTMVSTLNKKFKTVVGTSVTRPAPDGSNGLVLNQELLTP